VALPPGLRRARSTLSGLSRAAQQQDWDAERPWRARTHVWEEDGVLVVDLHDLKLRLAKKAVDLVVAAAPELGHGAVIFVTGRGRHSVGKAVLPEAIASKLQAVVAEHPGWQTRPGPAGRLVLVIDPALAPRHLQGGMSWLAAAVLLAVALAAAWLCAGKPGL
jgi:hypothetical protein